ncbi:MAG: leucine-rich repeat domain-containing protein [Mycoplasma sp.]
MNYKKISITMAALFAVAAVVVPTTLYFTNPEQVVKVPTEPNNPDVPNTENPTNDSVIELDDSIYTTLTIDELWNYSETKHDISKYVKISTFPIDIEFKVKNITLKDNCYEIEVWFSKFVHDGKIYENKYDYTFTIKLKYFNKANFLFENNILKGFTEEFKNSDEYKKWDGTLTIPSFDLEGIPISKIESGAFNNNQKITKIRFGELSAIKIIGSNAFSNCLNLTDELIIPKSVTEIWGSAFSNTKITKLSFQENSNLTKIFGSAFGWNKYLTGDIILPDSLQLIQGNVFAWCEMLNGTLYMPDGFKDFEISAFDGTHFTKVSVWGTHADWNPHWQSKFPKYFARILEFREEL